MFFMCQTHFGTPIGPQVLTELRRRGYQWCRVDAQGRSIDDMLAMVLECRAAGMTPYVIVDQLEQIEALPAYAKASWRNEPDIALGGRPAIPAEHYAFELKLAAEWAVKTPVREIGAPVVSNLNRRGVDYTEAVIGYCGGRLPEGVFGDFHRYGDGTYENPHRLNRWLPWGRFRSREEELRWLKQTIGPGRAWGISEWGYPSADGISEAQQADRSALEFELHESEGALFSGIYQLNDGHGTGGIDHFGLRRVDGSWKPVADILVIDDIDEPGPIEPPVEESDLMPTATPMLSRSQFLEVPGRTGFYTCRYPRGADTVLSIQPGGEWDTRPAGTAGPWEVFRIEGNRAVFPETETAHYGIPICD